MGGCTFISVRLTPWLIMCKNFMPMMALVGAVACAAVAEDAGERVYFTPTLNPQHQAKPKVTGWAPRRLGEKLNRGLVAVPTQEGKVYIGWRRLNGDAPETAFNIYRSAESEAPVKLNRDPIATTTDFIDTQPVLGRPCAYWVRPAVAGQELEPSEKARLNAEAHQAKLFYASIKFQGSYVPQRIAVADLNGDGAYDFVIKQPSQGIDPAGSPNTSGLTYKLEAYLNDGTFLWRKDLGPGIEPGIWYSPFVVYDFDGDGKAEVAVKTGPEDARDARGRVRNGPEWVSILDGMTGQEIAKADWPPRDPRLGDYNRINRNQLGIAYLDGKTPCLLVARGTYKLMVVDACQFHDKKLERLWHWEGDDERTETASVWPMPGPAKSLGALAKPRNTWGTGWWLTSTLRRPGWNALRPKTPKAVHPPSICCPRTANCRARGRMFLRAATGSSGTAIFYGKPLRAPAGGVAVCRS